MNEKKIKILMYVLYICFAFCLVCSLTVLINGFTFKNEILKIVMMSLQGVTTVILIALIFVINHFLNKQNKERK